MRTKELFVRYIGICNKAIENGYLDITPDPYYPDEHIQYNYMINYSIGNSSSAEIRDHFKVQYINGKLYVLAHSYRKLGPSWMTERNFLIDVVNNAEPFLSNPEKLKLDWLKIFLEKKEAV